MLKIYNKHTGEEISCEDKEQKALMLKNENFVKTAAEVDKSEQGEDGQTEEEVTEVKTTSNRKRAGTATRSTGKS